MLRISVDEILIFLPWKDVCLFFEILSKFSCLFDIFWRMYIVIFPTDSQFNILSSYRVCYWNCILLWSTLDRPWEDIYLKNIFFPFCTIAYTAVHRTICVARIEPNFLCLYTIMSVRFFLVLHLFPPPVTHGHHRNTDS